MVRKEDSSFVRTDRNIETVSDFKTADEHRGADAIAETTTVSQKQVLQDDQISSTVQG